MTALGAMLRRDLAPEELAPTARAIAPGLDELWIIEDLDWPGGIAQLMAVLDATADDASGRPVVGHGVAPAPFRNPATLAMEWATVARLHPGRLHAGIGHGVPGWMGRIGADVASPLTLLRETIEAVRLVLAGGSVTYVGRYVNLTDVQLVHPPTVVPPVLAGVTGPRSLELSGAVADGTVLSEGHDAAQVIAARERIATGRATPNAPVHHRFTLYVGFFLGEIRDLPPVPTDGPEGGFAAIADSPEHLAEQLRPILDVGIDSLVLVPFGDTIAQLDRFQAEVRPLLSL